MHEGHSTGKTGAELITSIEGVDACQKLRDSFKRALEHVEMVVPHSATELSRGGADDIAEFLDRYIYILDVYKRHFAKFADNDE